MKIIVTTILCTLFFISSFSQSKTIDKNYYLHKSKNQKVTGFVLLGTGAALLVTGAIIQHNSVKAKGAFLNFDGLGYQVGGLTCMLSSIPFFIWATKNKQKFISITLINQKHLIPNSGTFALKSQPGLAVNINF